MTLNEFINRHNGKKIDFDGAYGAQCVDVIKFWFRDLGLPIPTGNGYQYAKNADGVRVVFVKNTPSGVPKPGDVIVWNKGIGPYGHVAIFVEGNTNSFRSFDQNFPLNSACHIQSHDYKAVDGWLHPVQLDAPVPPPPPPPAPPPVDPCAANKAETEQYKELLRQANSHIGDLETSLKDLVENPKIIETTTVKEVPVTKIETVVQIKEVEPKWLSAIRNYITSYLGRNK